MVNSSSIVEILQLISLYIEIGQDKELIQEQSASIYSNVNECKYSRYYSVVQDFKDKFTWKEDKRNLRNLPVVRAPAKVKGYLDLC